MLEDGLLALLIILQVADFLTTRAALEAGAHEGNPILVRLGSVLGDRLGEWAWLVIPKAFFVVGLLWLREDGLLSGVTAAASLFCACCFYAWAAIHNHRLAETLRRRS